MRTDVGRRMARRAAIAAVALAACSEFSGSDDESPPDVAEAGAPEAGALDGTLADGATGDSGMMDAPSSDSGITNLLTNGDFELGCGGWSAVGGTLTEETTVAAHGQAKSCLVCTVGFTVHLTQTFTPIVLGKQYVGEAFIRTPGASFDAGAAVWGRLVVDETNEGPVTTGPALSDTWQRISMVLRPVEDGGVKMQFQVGGSGGCFLIDDARLYVSP